MEINPFCQKVLEKHWPQTDRGDDICKESPEKYERLYGTIDLICGGFPCQDLSVAGKRKGLAGERSGLFYELLRVADANPSAWVLAENVPGLLSSSEGRDFATVLGELSGFLPEVPEDGWRKSGVCYGSKGCVAWRVLDAQYFGVAQRRRRVFIVRSPSRAGAFQVLFESDCLPGNPPPSREAREGITRCVTASAGIDGDAETFVTNSDGSGKPGEVAATIDTRASNDPRQNQGGTAIVCDPISASGAGTARTGNERNEVDMYVASTLRSGGSGGIPSSRGENVFCVKGAAIGRKPEAGPQWGEILEDGTSYTLNTTEQHAVMALGHTKSNGLGISSSPVANTLESASSANQAVACWESLRRSDDVYRESGDVAPTLQGFMGTGGNNVPLVGVRRLTPIECARLQGFPDDHCILDEKTPDSPQYRAYGNAVCVNVAEWIGKRLAEILTDTPSPSTTQTL